MIFLALNLVRNLIIFTFGNGAIAQRLPSFTNLITIFVSGNLLIGDDKLVSFWILVPISYLLILSGVLTLLYRRYKYAFHVACLALLLSVGMLRLLGVGSYNLEFIAIGMIGVLSGFLPSQKVNDVFRHPYLFSFAYLSYVIAIAIWNVPFPLLIVGVLLNLIALYAIGSGEAPKKAIVVEIALLGKYSLLGYLSQLAFLQVLSIGFHHVNLGFASLPVSCFLAFVLTIVTSNTVDRARTKYAGADRLYKAIFA